MAHNIMQNKRFVSYQQPAWHGLGLVTDRQMSAMEAYRLAGEVPVTSEPVFTQSGLPTDHKAIIGEVDGKQIVYSVVSKDYQEITHGNFVLAWDRGTQAYVETLGMLGQGEILFISTKLEMFDIKGDAVQQYLMAYSPLNGKEAITLRLTPVRVVCQNTLNLSASRCSEEHRIIHTQSIMQDVESWLRVMYNKVQFKTEAIREAFQILASASPNTESMDTFTKTIYPDPVQPDADPQTKEGLDSLAKWEKDCGKMRGYRETVYNLFEGRGVGLSQPQIRGTWWAAYNAVTQHEDWERSYRRASSILCGAGARRKEQALEVSVDMAKQ